MEFTSTLLFNNKSPLYGRWTTIFLLFFFSLSGYQLSAQNGIEKEVQTTKSLAPSSTMDLLQVKTNKSVSDRLDAELPLLTDYSVLSLDKASSQKLMDERPIRFDMVLPDAAGTEEMELELIRFDLLSEDYEAVEMPSGEVITGYEDGVFYRGVVKGAEGSIAIVSLIGNELSGLISRPGVPGEVNLVKLEDTEDYLLYNDAEVQGLFSDYSCNTIINEDSNPLKQSDIDEEELFANEKVNGCFGIHFDIGVEVTNAQGGRNGAISFIQGAFAQVASLYADEQINITLSGTTVWTSTEPFFNSLNGYQSYRSSNNVSGSLAHYVNRGSGGVAYLRALCSKSFGYGLSGVGNSFSTVPNYSWTVNILAHELGHNFGSEHTHDCAWNGNNTPIDGCGSRYNGCGTSNYFPPEGGTIMSYCHLVSVGVNLALGFGPQPGNRMRSTASRASCNNATGCNGGGGGGDDNGDGGDDDNGDGGDDDNGGGGDDNGGGGGGTCSVTFKNVECNAVYAYYNSNGSLTYYTTIQAGATLSVTASSGLQWYYYDTDLQLQDSYTQDCSSSQYDITSGGCGGGGGSSTCIAIFTNGSCSYTVDYYLNQNGSLTYVGQMSPGTLNTVSIQTGQVWSFYIGNYSLGSAQVSCSDPNATITGDCLPNRSVGIGEGVGVKFELPTNFAAAENSLEVWPNPTSQRLNVKLSLVDPTQESQVRLLDATGRVVEERMVEPAAANGQIDFNVTRLPAGMYFVQVITGKDRMVERVIVSH